MDRALPLSLLVALFLLTYSVASAKETLEANEGLCTAAVRIDDICPTFQKIFDKFESYSDRISELERKVELDAKKIVALELELKVVKTGFEKCLCDSDPDPLSDFDRIFADNVIARYNFEKNVEDSSGNGHHGSASGGVTYVSQGVAGVAASFQGKQKISVESLRNFKWGSSFSVSVWFKRTGEWSNYQGIVSSGYYSTGSWELRMGREMSGQKLGGGVVTADSQKTWNYGDILATQNEWHHVAMTYDGAELSYYLDNVRQEGDRTCCSGDILIKNTPVTIGQAGVGTSNEYFYGLIDELTIFSKVLGAKEISTIYNTQNSRKCSDPSLIAYFPFDGSYNDESCYKRHGKPVGGVSLTSSRSNYVSGGSAQFSGGKVVVDVLSGYNWGDKFTVSVWFKRTRTSGYQGIVSNGYYTQGSWEIRMGEEYSGQMLRGGVVTKQSKKPWDYKYLKAALHKWHHVAMVYDGSRLLFYLDNVKQKGDDTCCSGDMLARDNPLYIGAAGDREYFHGYIDELKLFSRALSASEVSKIYKEYA